MSRRQSAINRRTFLQLAVAGTVGAETIFRADTVRAVSRPTGKPTLRVEIGTARALVSVLSWDTEGGDRARSNLLREPLTLRVRVNGERRAAADLPSTRQADGKDGTHFRIRVAPEGELLWGIYPAADRLSMTLARQGTGMGRVEGVEMVFPLHSPSIDKIEVVKKGDVKRAKLYYLKRKVGKETKVDEKVTLSEGGHETAEGAQGAGGETPPPREKA